MKTIVIGTSTIGNAITTLFRDNGHDVIQVGRTSGDAQADLTDISSLRSLFAQRRDLHAESAGPLRHFSFREDAALTGRTTTAKTSPLSEERQHAGRRPPRANLAECATLTTAALRRK